MPRTDVSRFLEMVQSFKDVWSHIEIRCVAYKVAPRQVFPNELYSLGAVAHLVREAIPRELPELNAPPLDKLMLLRDRIELDKIESVVAMLSQGSYTIDNQQVFVIGPEQGGKILSQGRADWFADSRTGQVFQGEYSGHSVSIHQGSSGEKLCTFLMRDQLDIEELDLAVRRLKRPYIDFCDFLSEYLGYRVQDRYGYANPHILAHVEAGFVPETRLVDGLLTVVVEHDPLLQVEQFSIGMIVHSQNNTKHRARIKLQPGGSSSSGSRARAVRDQSLSQLIPKKVDILLQYGDCYIGRLEVQESNPRGTGNAIASLQSLSAYDAITKGLLEGDNPKRKPESQHIFEGAVGNILSLNQMQVFDIGKVRRARDEIDFIAFPPSREYCLAIECTTGGIESKISNLKSRVGKVRSALDIPVVQIVATSMERGQLSEASLDDALRDKMLVWTRESLQDLLRIGAAGGDQDEFKKMLRLDRRGLIDLLR